MVFILFSFGVGSQSPLCPTKQLTAQILICLLHCRKNIGNIHQIIVTCTYCNNIVNGTLILSHTILLHIVTKFNSTLILSHTILLHIQEPILEESKLIPLDAEWARLISIIYKWTKKTFHRFCSLCWNIFLLYVKLLLRESGYKSCTAVDSVT